MNNAVIKELFDLNETIAKDLFEGKTYAWEVLPEIKDFVLKIGPTLPKDKFDQIGEDIWVAKSAKVFDSAYLNGPLIVDEEAEIRHCAFVRGSAIVGKKSVVGNSTELKNSILFNNVEAPHYNYVGDSVLGFHAHMGAGSITSNIKSDRTNIVVKDEDESIATGMRKIGAILGDYVEVGCNSVLNPGTVVGKHSNIYPLSMVRGVVPSYSIFKNKGNSEIVKKEVQ